MANLIGNKVSTFTPVDSFEDSWIKYPAAYLKPFGGRAAFQIPGMEREDGSKGAIRIQYRPPWYATAAIIASYILTLGILPLLAAIATAAIRCNYKFHWIPNAPVIDINQINEQLGQLMQDPLIRGLMRNPAEAIQGLMRPLEQAQRQNAQLRQLPNPGPNPRPNPPPHPSRVHGLRDLQELQEAEQAIIPPLHEQPPSLANKPGGHRLSEAGHADPSPVDKRKLALEAAEARLKAQAERETADAK